MCLCVVVVLLLLLSISLERIRLFRFRPFWASLTFGHVPVVQRCSPWSLGRMMMAAAKRRTRITRTAHAGQSAKR